MTIELTGVPLLDAIAAAMLAARAEGEAVALGDVAAVAEAHSATLAATDEVMRLWRQFDIEINGARRARPDATRCRAIPGTRGDGEAASLPGRRSPR